LTFLVDDIRRNDNLLAKVMLTGTLLEKRVSKFQTIEIYNTALFGRALVIDNDIQMTYKDEKIYHTKMTAEVKKGDSVLIIGGGDGGIARECLKKTDSVHLVEIDKNVYDMCREHLPQTACSFSDPRIKVTFDDGFEYMKTTTDRYDIVIADHNEYADFNFNDFHVMASKVLRDSFVGTIISHLGEGIEFIEPKRIIDTKKYLKENFKSSYVKGFYVPSWFPGKYWKTMARNTGL
jgi:spermidine synthase